VAQSKPAGDFSGAFLRDRPQAFIFCALDQSGKQCQGSREEID
jgi:hypothetical protein